jgi:hypothetical protein
MRKIIIITVLASLILTGCGDPKEEAREIAQLACVADINSDIASLNELMNEEMFELNKVIHQNADPQMKRILKMLNCDVKSIEALEENGFVVNFKKHNSYEVKEVGGDLKVVGERLF